MAAFSLGKYTTPAKTMVDDDEADVHSKICIYTSSKEKQCRTYLIKKDVLGEGSFGQVFQCKSKSPVCDITTTYAIKRIVISDDPEENSEAMISDEVNNLKHLQSKCGEYLLCIVDNGFDRYQPEYYYIVMEDLSAWKRIDTVIKTRKLFSDEAILMLIDEMASGLLFMHNEVGMSHLDIKPANMYCSFEGEHGATAEKPRIKFIDFGLAVRFDPSIKSDLRCVRGFRGSYFYRDAYGKTQGLRCPASDYFSLGIVMLELMTGERITKYCDKFPECSQETSLEYTIKYANEMKKHSIVKQILGKSKYEFKVFDPIYSERYIRLRKLSPKSMTSKRKKT